MNLQNTNILMAFLTPYGNKMRLLKTLLHSRFGRDVCLLFTGELESVPSPYMREKGLAYYLELALYYTAFWRKMQATISLPQCNIMDVITLDFLKENGWTEFNAIKLFHLCLTSCLRRLQTSWNCHYIFAFCKHNGGLLMNKMEGWWSLEWWMDLRKGGMPLGYIFISRRSSIIKIFFRYLVFMSVAKNEYP